MSAAHTREPSRNERLEVDFLEGLRKRCPGNPRLLEVLGTLYTRFGRYEEGLSVDLELVRMHPEESIVWYNLGCSYALTGRRDDALRALSRAVELGYGDSDWMLKDSDLESLRDDPRFQVLLGRIGTGRDAGRS